MYILIYRVDIKYIAASYDGLGNGDLMTDIQCFKNIFKDKTAIVMGSGCSLKNVDIKLLHKAKDRGMPIIAVNAAIGYYHDSQFFVTDDKNVKYWSYYDDMLDRNNKTKMVIARRFATDFELNDDRFVIVDTVVSNRIEENRFITSKTSVSLAISFAHYIGCNTICLLGCDVSNDCGKKYFWEYDGFKKYTNSKDRDINSVNQDNVYESMLSWWSKFAYANQTLNIINCNTRSLITDFPKIELEKFI